MRRGEIFKMTYPIRLHAEAFAELFVDDVDLLSHVLAHTLIVLDVSQFVQLVIFSSSTVTFS